MIRSMTAFAGADLSTDDLSVSIEIRGYNSRYLDVALRMPQQYAPLEERVRRALSEEFVRGRVEIRVSIDRPAGEAAVFEINETTAAAYFNTLKRLKEMFDLEQIPLALLATRTGIIETAEMDLDMEALWEMIRPCLDQALERFNAMKADEGRTLYADLQKRLCAVEKMIEKIDRHRSGLPALYQDRLKERIAALTGGIAEIDPARIAQEAAFLADRSDISEEVVRAKSHLKQFRQLMDSPSPAGRPLNFLLQEFNREFNTMGSKAGNADIAHIIVEAKTELEKMREQVQNIE